jgi:serine/threonine-protein kinase
MTFNPAVAESDRTDGRMSGQVVGGRYRLQQQLGRGGMASVWRARDTRLDRSAAIKLLDPTWRGDPVALERLRREAHSVAGLDHQNIVGVYDFDVADDAAYLVMELVDGRSVSELLAAQGPLPVEQAVSIGAQVCAALGAAHAAGVVHRDIKPSNILVSPTGAVKVCDFGIARLQRAAGQAALTDTGAVVGTCHYMAPEQATGGRVDGRSDLYAVGCVLYMMLTGAPPFSGTNAMDILDLHLHEPPVPLSAHRDDVPAALDRLVAELLAKDSIDRPPTAWSVRDRLTAMGGRSPAVGSRWTANASNASASAVAFPADQNWSTADDWSTADEYGPAADQYEPAPDEYGPADEYGPPADQYEPTPDQYEPTPGQYGPPASQYRPPAGQYGPPAGADWPIEPTVVTPVVAAAPVAAASDDNAPTGRHRSALVGVPTIAWLRQSVSGWVLALVATAVVTSVIAVIALAWGGEPDTSLSAPSSSSITAPPDPEVITADPTASADPGQPATQPPPSASATPSAAITTSPPRSKPIDQIVGLAAVIQRQSEDGQLPRKDARFLLRDLDEVARLLNDGSTAQAAARFAEFRDRAAELRSDGKLTGALPDLDRIADSIASG